MDPPAKINFIPCVKWIKKGAAKNNPDKVQLNKNELVGIINEAKSTRRSNIQAISGIQQMNTDDEYGFSNYDNEEEVLGLSGLAEIEGEADQHFSDSDDSEKDDDIIKSGDSLILAGRVEDDASIMEVYVYNEDEKSLYVHHDFLLPAFPLCIEWLDHEVGHPPGNYCAIGSLNPIIDVWDLDIVNCLEPAFKLGRKASRRKGLEQLGHTDAVLDVAWNKNYDHILASASVDQSILLWDLDQGEPATAINAFTDKVQCLDWHKFEAQTLLAGACDKTVKVFDCRNTDVYKTWEISGESERVTWNPVDPFTFFVATSVGDVQYFDCRQGLVWSVKAHEKEVTGFDVSAKCPGLFVTASSDGLIKIWDVAERTQPFLVHENNFNIGAVHCIELCPDLPFVMTAGGDKKDNNFLVYDIQNIYDVKNTFQSRPLVQLTTQDNN